jgi:hypothetical protein
MDRTLRRVGFALGRKLLLWFASFYFGKVADFHSQRGIWRKNDRAVELGLGFIPERTQRLRLAEMILFPL